MTWDTMLLVNVILLVLALVIRKIYVHIWSGEDDPFGRHCKNLGAIDHPEYQALRAENPTVSFLQLDVVMLDLGETTTAHVLLKNPHEAKSEKHLAYFQLDGIVFQQSLGYVVESIIQPWKQLGYSPVAGALSRSYV